MLRRSSIMVVVSLLLASLACQATLGFLSPTPTPIPPTATLTLTPTASPIPPSPTPTWTPVPPTAVPPTPTLLQLQVFEQLWRNVREEYLYPDFNGLDWNAVHDEYLHRIEAGLTQEEYYSALSEMINLLNDDHSVFFNPKQVAAEEAQLSGANDYVGIGVYTTAVPERQRVTIIVVFPGSPAEHAGLISHDSILAIDGQPVVDESGVHSDRMRGPEGTTVTLTVQSPGEQPRQVSITRKRIQGALPVPYQVLQSPNGKQIGYILLASFADDTVGDQVGEALKELNRGARLDGLILDNRLNGGGLDTVTSEILGYFTSGTLGFFMNRKLEKRSFIVTSLDIRDSTHLPLVVLVGGNTVSYGEIFSGVLQESGRAYLIGTRTMGNVELLWQFDYEDGSRAWLAHDAFHPQKHPNQTWEKVGVNPDLVVPSNWDEVTLSTDPAVLAALSYLDSSQK
jgi:carboxyl-terminal processing protease